jgi:RNA-directed DNA polymerase
VHARTRYGTTTPKDKSRQLQRKLYLAAKRSRDRRFHALYDRMFRPDVLRRAWEEVRRKGGSAGVDGEAIEDVEWQGVEEFLGRIEQDLKAKKYRPQPVVRVLIPKADGGQRPLGIPTVRDRVVQQACKIVIEPVFEANFQDSSYGFRPKRSAQQAVLAVKEALVMGWWVVDADIQSYFESIDHEAVDVSAAEAYKRSTGAETDTAVARSGCAGRRGSTLPGDGDAPGRSD